MARSVEEQSGAIVASSSQAAKSPEQAAKSTSRRGFSNSRSSHPQFSAIQPTLQRREYPDGTASAQLQSGDWTASDRVNETTRWQTACIYNLASLRSREYTQPHERRDFYLWFYNYTSGLGWQTRWPLAAYLVASGAAHLSYGSPFSNSVQVAARQGNQIIFDDVFPKLRALLQGGPLTGAAAQAWDAQTLGDEQQLVESMYASMSPATIQEFAKYASQKGILANLGAVGGFDKPHRGGKYHRVQAIPGFIGDIKNIDDRFRYGMNLADQFSTHPAPASPISRPAPGATYKSGAAFQQLNQRMGLHQLDAELDDFNVNERRVIEIMQSLSSDEQRELGFNQTRLDFLHSALNQAEMTEALNGLTSVPINDRQFLLS